MTDLEILSRSLNEIDSIEVPVQYTEKIALPLCNVSNLLKLLYNAIVDNMKKQQEAAAAQAAQEPAEEPETPKPGLRVLTNAVDEVPENPNEEVPDNVE